MNSWSSKLFFLFLIPVMFISCGKAKNSSSNDKAQFGFSNTGGDTFKTAFPILAKNCNGCHSAWNNYNEADFINSGLIINNLTTQSPLYYRIINNDSGISGDMPLTGSPLTSDDILSVKRWIQSATL